ncbi:hypothetical protein E1B28_007183 [Marasmius oreades]|uniref:Uncharacterized protein n=1 Tax=Marasmius oreades TaxID=181124 RepID=A0A9P7S2U4_9AGAR|nr:uncharacterized protein E1B28_007183 [Marasmius oreades]KAG7093508.1 hypothetical protein E1B28_007183 [Marasmius oreades]
MFYYISFLRPPPCQALPTSPIRITPQIANDLRTELFDGSQDIYFSWSLANDNSPTSQTTKPTKLTTWRQENAYKEMTVPLPPKTREGQTWRLILSPTSDMRIYGIDLEGKVENLGKQPFSVISKPILFTKFAGKSLGKQEQIERLYRFSMETPSQGVPGGEVTLRITEQTSFDLDKKVWDSGIGLSFWLINLAAKQVGAEESGNVHDLFSPSPLRILELGAGTGIVSLVLSALRSGVLTSPSEPEHEENCNCIITTDLPSAMPLLEHNISSNSHLFLNPTYSAPTPKVLDWDEDLPEFTQKIPGNLDFILMADVTYNTSSFPALIRTLSSLISLNRTEDPPVIIMGYKERDPAERSLWNMVQEIGIRFNKVAEVPGAGGTPIEIWIGKVITKIKHDRNETEKKHYY